MPKAPCSYNAKHLRNELVATMFAAISFEARSASVGQRHGLSFFPYPFCQAFCTSGLLSACLNGPLPQAPSKLPASIRTYYSTSHLLLQPRSNVSAAESSCAKDSGQECLELSLLPPPGQASTYTVLYYNRVHIRASYMMITPSNRDHKRDPQLGPLKGGGLLITGLH